MLTNSRGVLGVRLLCGVLAAGFCLGIIPGAGRTDAHAGMKRLDRCVDHTKYVDHLRNARKDFPWIGAVTAKQVIAASSPDNSFQILKRFYDTASKTIEISIYQIDNDYVGDILEDALKRGVRVTILFEGAPIPRLQSSELYIASRLVKRGAEIYFYNDPQGRSERVYKYLHNKYGIVDGARVIVGSANYGNKGHPVEPTLGNREWMVVIDDPRVAKLFQASFEHDINLCEEVSAYGSEERFTFDDPDFEPNRETPPGKYTGGQPILNDFDVPIQTVFAPENSLSREKSIYSLLKSATRTLEISQLNFETYWGGPTKRYNPTLEDSPLLKTVLAQARAGVRVRVLLNDDNIFKQPRGLLARGLLGIVGGSYESLDVLNDWLEPEAETGSGAVARDNRETIRVLTEVANNEGLQLEGRLLDFRRCGLAVLHNKGAIADSERAIVGSLNWGESALKFNREAGILFQSQRLARYYQRGFEYDWKCSR